MIARICLSAIGLIVLASSAAAEESHPTALAGFIEPGMHLGIGSMENGVGYNIVIFTSKEFEIEQDARVLDVDELVNRHPSVAARRDKAFSDLKKSLESRKEDLPPGQSYSEPQLILSVDRRLLLCTVQHVGSDYLLVKYASDEKRRKVFATRYIAGIRWGDTLRMSTNVRRIRETRR